MGDTQSATAGPWCVWKDYSLPSREGVPPDSSLLRYQVNSWLNLWKGWILEYNVHAHVHRHTHSSARVHVNAGPRAHARAHRLPVRSALRKVRSGLPSLGTGW